jgi:glutathione S-transferase
MKLFIANKNYSSWSLRPWVLMRVLEIPFEESLEPFGSSAAETTQQFKQFSPSAQVPCLHDGELRVWDSLAITEYLAERYPAVWPADVAARAWARSATSQMHSGFSDLRAECSMTCGQRIVLRHVTAGLSRDLQRLDELWCEGLARFGGPFLAGACFTAVDAFYAPVAFRLQTYGLRLSLAADAYRDCLLALPAMGEWYAAALLEPWREAAHEAEIASRAQSLTDLRAL